MSAAPPREGSAGRSERAGRRPSSERNDSDKNRCRACGFKWFPAGIDRATKCPRCDSEDIEFSWTERWPAYAGCAAIAAFAAAVLWTAAKLGYAYLGH